ncbi:hypothetical protein [Lactobacillus sp. ESL0677]|uniref:hypothetical protein n=1 Tax=Lactobacillus sp. ESL0677 TaxID=2983208 RepID=UPI0023F7A7F7|nr:hypothetical protein [Lactobacillus sp. ESL0677]WEV37691.1 hypothetical protein OZX76_03830 [Lactobacillus sp. ESL0677]
MKIIIRIFMLVIFWGIAAYLLYPAFDTWKKHEEGIPRHYSWLRIIVCGYFGIAFLFGPIAGIYDLISPSDTSSNNQTEETKTKDNSDNIEKEQAEQQQKENKAADKQKKFNAKVNKYLKKSLREDQNFFAKGDKRYNYSPFINSIKYTGQDNSDRANVQVNTDFIELDNESKSAVAEKVQGVIGATLATVKDDYTQEEQNQGAGLFFYFGKRAVGHSKLWNSHKYKWYNFD